VGEEKLRFIIAGVFPNGSLLAVHKRMQGENPIILERVIPPEQAELLLPKGSTEANGPVCAPSS
jgi:hypothetical protein